MSLTIALGALKAVAAIKQGKAMQASYNLQAQQAELQGRQKALNYSRQAMGVLQDQRRMMGTIAARGAAGGVNVFSGSAMTVNEQNAFRMGEEYNLGLENADMAIAGSLAQSQSLRAAGKQAMKSAYFNAAISLGSSMVSSAQTATPGGASWLNPDTGNTFYYGQ